MSIVQVQDIWSLIIDILDPNVFLHKNEYCRMFQLYDANPAYILYDLSRVKTYV